MRIYRPGRASLLGIAAAILVSACGDDGDKPLTASNIALQLREEETVSGALLVLATGPKRARISYQIVRGTAHGKLDTNLSTGVFSYAPETDFFGNDSFMYVAFDGSARSRPATVTLTVENVNDAPRLSPIPDLKNSPEVQVVKYRPTAIEVDGESVVFEVTSDNPSVASVTIDPVANILEILPHDYGETAIHVTARDSQLSASLTFRFSVADVTKERSVATDPSQAIVVSNTTSAPVRFTFTHNGFPLFQSDEQIAEFVRAMSEAYPGEPFERKLWRFINESTYHAVQLSNDDWAFDPWVTVNSLGWGLCSQVSAVYVRVARAAGYPSRMWGLEGHVVPEIQIDGEWQMYDPDLAVYYRTPDLRVAGVAQLQADTSLITAPISPIFETETYPYPYSDFIAGIYGEPLDNIAASENSQMAPTNYQPLVLPVGASLTYPLMVDPSVTGMHSGEAFAIPHYLQAALTLSGDWTGELTMPWIVWGISGEGVVAIDDKEYEVGSESLEERIRSTLVPVTSIRILASATPLTLTFFINALRYELAPQNSVILTGRDIWALDVDAVVVPEPRRMAWNHSAPYKKLQPTAQQPSPGRAGRAGGSPAIG